MADALVEEFNILPFNEVAFPLTVIEPIYGLTILPDPLVFCCRCGHGYRDEYTLRGHQKNECARSANSHDEYFIAYGQSFGFTNAIFPVDISQLPRAPPTFNAAKLFIDTLPLPKDYSREPLSVPQNNQDLDLLFQREGWIELVEGWTPLKLNILTSAPDKWLKPELATISTHVLGYLEIIQKYIQKHASQGLCRIMAQVGT